MKFRAFSGEASSSIINSSYTGSDSRAQQSSQFLLLGLSFRSKCLLNFTSFTKVPSLACVTSTSLPSEAAQFDKCLAMFAQFRNCLAESAVLLPEVAILLLEVVVLLPEVAVLLPEVGNV